jgi:Ca2+-binding EF-hand superfamily protein
MSSYSYMEEKLEEEAIAEIKEALSLFHISHDWKITAQEIGCVMRSLGLTQNFAELTNLIKELEQENDGLKRFEIVIRLLISKSKLMEEKEIL